MSGCGGAFLSSICVHCAVDMSEYKPRQIRVEQPERHKSPSNYLMSKNIITTCYYTCLKNRQLLTSRPIILKATHITRKTKIYILYHPTEKYKILR